MQQNRTRAVAADFGAAMHELQSTSPGIERVETFVRRLRAINTKSAVPEVREALQGYISALEPSIVAARSGQSVTPFNRSIAQARQRLSDAVRENE